MQRPIDMSQMEWSRQRTFRPQIPQWPNPWCFCHGVKQEKVSLLILTFLKNILPACFRITLINCLDKYSWNKYDGITSLSSEMKIYDSLHPRAAKSRVYNLSIPPVLLKREPNSLSPNSWLGVSSLFIHSLNRGLLCTYWAPGALKLRGPIFSEKA